MNLITTYQVAAISESSEEFSGSEGHSNAAGWKSFDMHAVVSATEDLLLFILSKNGRRVRAFLLRDIITAADAAVQNDGLDHSDDAKSNLRKRSSEVSLSCIQILTGLSRVMLNRDSMLMYN